MNRQTETEEYTTDPWTNLISDDQKHCWAKLFKIHAVQKSTVPKIIIVQKSVVVVWDQVVCTFLLWASTNSRVQIKWGLLPRIWCSNWNEDYTYIGTYIISHACPHIYRTSTTMHIVIVAIVACWKHLEKCHLSDEVQFGQQ